MTEHSPGPPVPSDAPGPDAPGPAGPAGPAQGRLSRPAGIADRLQDDLLEASETPQMHWSVTWADLMMTMFILFAVLFVYASAKRDFLQAFRGRSQHENVNRTSSTVGSQQGPLPLYDMPTSGVLPSLGPRELFEMTKAAVAAQGIKDVSVEMQGDSVRISMHGPMLFARTSAQVSPEAERFLGVVSGILAKARYQVGVHGHTDNFPVSTPDHATNWELSAARAVNVARLLIESRGLDPALVTATAHAMYQPVSPNLTTESKAQNRRVEIILTRPPAETPTKETP